MADEKKDQETEEKTPETTEETPKVTETPDGGVEVSLEEEKEEETPKETQEEKKEKPPVSEEEKLKSRLGYQERMITKLQREIGQLKPPEIPAKEPEEQPADELDKLAQTDWKAAVGKVAEKEAKRIYQEEQQRIREQSQQLETQTQIEKNAQVALERHPELEDTSSEKSQIWFNILNQNPNWQQSPDGPMLTMYKMEEELRKRGYDVEGIISKKVETEKERFVRANQANLPSSRPTTPPNKIVLTKEQREFCDLNGIKYEDYARTQKTGGSEVEL